MPFNASGRLLPGLDTSLGGAPEVVSSEGAACREAPAVRLFAARLWDIRLPTLSRASAPTMITPLTMFW